MSKRDDLKKLDRLSEVYLAEAFAYYMVDVGHDGPAELTYWAFGHQSTCRGTMTVQQTDDPKNAFFGIPTRRWYVPGYMEFDGVWVNMRHKRMERLQVHKRQV